MPRVIPSVARDLLRRSLVAALLGMTLPAHGADRVIALAPHLAELACAAGGCDRLVGVVAWSDYPESVKALPQVGDAFAVNVEHVVSLRPDLVLAWDGGTPRELIERLRGLDLRVETLAIRRLDEVAGGLRQVGAWLGTPGTAEMAAARYDAGLNRLRARHRDLPELRVFYQIEWNPPYSVNRDSPISQAIELCGGRNVFADLPTLAAPVNREAVVARDPQVVVFTRQDDVAAVRRYWARGPGVAATKAGALYEIDGNLLDRATPRLLAGVGQLCDALSDARAKYPATRLPGRPSRAPAREPPQKENPKGG
jgi:iron complex transport system substrate-binding protein